MSSPICASSLGEAAERAVVREDPAVDRERVAVLHGLLARGCEADVRYELRRADVPRLARKRRVAERGQRLLVEHRCVIGREVAEPRPVGIAMALVGETVRRVEQPERGVYTMR